MLARWFDPARSRQMLLLAGPIVIGMSSQVVMNLVDTGMVGALGPAPQAAVGLGSIAFWVIANAVVGVGMGVQAVAARRDGEGDRPAAGAALDTGLVLVAVIGLPLGYFLADASPAIFARLSDDPEVVLGGSNYLAVRLVGLGAVAACYCFRGFYNGIGQSTVYLTSIVLMQVVNIFLNWVFIYGNLGARAMGVRGAALATVVAAIFGVCFYSILTLVRSETRLAYKPFRFRSLKPRTLGRMVSLSWPEGLRGVVVMVAFLAFLALHQAIDTRAAAAGTILLNIAMVGFMPALGVGLAGATMLGRHLGAGDPEEGRRMVWLGVRLCAAVYLLPAVLGWIFAEPVLAVFTPDVPVIELARPALRLFAILGLVDLVPVILLFSLLGAGATRWVAGVQVVQQYLLLLPLAWFFGLYLGHGVLGLWVGLVLSRLAVGAVAVLKFRSSSWEQIEV